MADLHTEIEARRKASTPEPQRLARFRAYARGRQQSTLSPKQRKILQNVLGNLFCDNVCAKIIGAFRDRLRLARFSADGQGTPYDKLIEFLHNTWVLNSMAAFAGDVHWSTLRDGNHAVSLSWVKTPSRPEGRVVFSRELWWDGKQGIFVAYDDLGSPEYAVKEWYEYDGGRYVQRRTVYYPNRIRRFVKENGGWRPYAYPGEPANGVIPWTRTGEPGGEELGIPVVHFMNRQVPQDPDYQDRTTQPDPFYGASELDGGILGLQDEINDIHRDITGAARMTAFQMLYATGYKPKLDSSGNEVAPVVEPGTIMTSPDPQAKFGAIPPGDISQLITTLDRKIKAACDNAEVPNHIITGQWPSGQALLRSEMGLVNKVVHLGNGLGPSWGSVMHKATVLQNTFGLGFEGTRLDEGLMIQAIFEDPEQLDDITRAEVAKMRSEFVSQREVLRLLGYTPDEIDKILEELEEDRKMEDERAELDLERQRIALENDRAASGSVDGPDDDEDTA